MGYASARANVSSGSSGSRGRSRAAITSSDVRSGGGADGARRRPQLQPGCGSSSSITGIDGAVRVKAERLSDSGDTDWLQVEASILALPGQVGIVIGIVIDDVSPPLAQVGDLMRVRDHGLRQRLVVVESRVGSVNHLEPGLPGPETKVSVIEGDGKVFLVEPADGVEDVPVNESASKGHGAAIAHDV